MTSDEILNKLQDGPTIQIVTGPRNMNVLSTMDAMNEAEKFFGVTRKELMSRDRTERVSKARLWVYTRLRSKGMTTTAIAKVMCRDTQTVQHGIQKTLRRLMDAELLRMQEG